jgi:hypothetical protein
MSLSVNLLTSPAQCDAVTAAIDEKLRIIGKRAFDADYQRDGATGDAANISNRLARLSSKITELNSSLGNLTPGTDEYRKTEEELTDAQYEQRKLGYRQADRGPVYLLLREADVDETAGRRASLEASRAAVLARRAQL